MKYVIVYLSLIILILYATLDYQIDKTRELTGYTAKLKAEISARTGTINLLENYRQTLKPPRVLPLLWPMVKEEYDDLTSYWAFRNDPLRRNTGGSNKSFHPAVDMTGVKGAQVLSSGNGIVLEKYYEKGLHYVNGKWRKFAGHKYFNGYVTIQHESFIPVIFYMAETVWLKPSGIYDGIISHYGHVAEILVHEGDRVTAGQQIAQISQQVDDYSTGPHLDFRLQLQNGEYVNPLLWIGGIE